MKNIKEVISAIILISLLFVSCNKDEEDSNDSNANLSNMTSPFYFSAEFDGQNIAYQSEIDLYGNGAGAGTGTVDGGCEMAQLMIIQKINSSNESIRIIVLKKFPECPTDCIQIENMFNLGLYPYGKSSNTVGDNNMEDGVVIYYIDSDGIKWQSDFGIGIQTNSNFTLVEHIDNNIDAMSEKISKAEFSCTLYDGNGNSKLLTNGLMRSRSVQCGNL